MHIVCDYKKCTGCLACVISCLDHHDPSGEQDMISRRLYHKITNPSGYMHYITESCHHCENAPCVKKCPVHAIVQQADGWTVVDTNQCIGCRVCAKVCPFDVPRFNSNGKMIKYDGCGGDPNCVKICPNQALAVILSE